MGNSLEELLSMPKISDKKIAIMESFENLRKWREEQRQKFMTMQCFENGKFVNEFADYQNNDEKDLAPEKKNLYQNDIPFEGSQISLESNITTASTPTSHMIRCFNDTSQSSIILSNYEQLSDQTKPPEKQIKKPFLRKRSGLIRYMPKSTRHKVDPENKIAFEQQEEKLVHFQSDENFKTKSCNFSSKPVTIKKVYFKESELEKSCEMVSAAESSDQFLDKENEAKHNDSIEILSSIEDATSNTNANEHQKMDFVTCCKMSNPGNESIELAQYELLEQYAQNSSFNSDSSIVRDIFEEKPLLCPLSEENAHLVNQQNIISKGSPSRKMNWSAILQEAKKTKKHTEDLIRDTNTRINKLQEEISIPQKEIFLNNTNFMTERCSTPVEKASVFMETNNECGVTTPKTQQEMPHIPIMINEGATSLESKNKQLCDNTSSLANNVIPKNFQGYTEATRGPLIEKIEELEKEIENYQSLKARLVEICKEREDVLKKLKKEYDGIEKYKEEQKTKFEKEIENERRQLKRERETFNRFKKLQKEHFSGKERKELATLRQENEKLKEEIKQQKNKFSKDIQRMKNQLINAEKEADTSKLKVISLEEQVDDLLDVLKARNFKTKKSSLIATKMKKAKNDKIITSESEFFKDCNEDETPNELKTRDLIENDSDKGSPNIRPRVRFNLIPQFHNSVEEITLLETQSLDCNDIKKDTFEKSSSNTYEHSKSEGIKFSELSQPSNHAKNIGKKIEKIHQSGEREILFPNGNRKIISADEKTVTIFFYNGDVKNIYPDQREVYKYANGVIEECLPSGLKITTFLNGQTEHRFPNGFEEIKYPDGTVHKFFTDGSEVMIGTNGMKDTIKADGTRILESDTGHREIKTANYIKREFPDGSVKIIYANGRKESRHSNGRIRIKDKDGKEIFDTKNIWKNI